MKKIESQRGALLIVFCLCTVFFAQNSHAQKQSWSQLNDVDYNLSKGKEEDCGDGGLQFSTEKNISNLRFGPRIQFSFRNDQKITETGEKSQDTGCQYSTTTTAESDRIVAETRSEHCTDLTSNNTIKEELRIVDNNTLEFNFSRKLNTSKTGPNRMVKETKFRCVYKRAKTEEPEKKSKP